MAWNACIALSHDLTLKNHHICNVYVSRIVMSCTRGFRIRSSIIIRRLCSSLATRWPYACTCIVYVLVYSHVLIFFCILFFLFLYIAYCTDINSSVFKYLSSSASNTFFARLYLLSLLRIKFKNKIFVEIIMNHFIFV